VFAGCYLNYFSVPEPIVSWGSIVHGKEVNGVK
jgi:hypothetical protein